MGIEDYDSHFKKDSFQCGLNKNYCFKYSLMVTMTGKELRQETGGLRIFYKFEYSLRYMERGLKGITYKTKEKKNSQKNLKINNSEHPMNKVCNAKRHEHGFTI